MWHYLTIGTTHFRGLFNACKNASYRRTGNPVKEITTCYPSAMQFYYLCNPYFAVLCHPSSPGLDRSNFNIGDTHLP